MVKVCGTDTADIVVTVQEKPILETIIVDPPRMIMYVGASRSINSITAYYDDATTAEIELDSDNVSYNVDSTDIITVTSGEVTGVSAGTATITVAYAEGGAPEMDNIVVTVIE